FNKDSIKQEPVDIKDSNWHISISPNGKYIVTFNHENMQFNIVEYDQYNTINKQNS
ncbi:5567_t:CDS:2, partial [Funneliformis geosporum]